MGEPSRVTFARLPVADGDGYVIETGAAAGMTSHLKAEHLFGVRCHICGAQAGMGTDGRLYMEHDYAKHAPAFPASTADTGGPVRREAESDRWWDA